jgi:hypothetical protein
MVAMMDEFIALQRPPKMFFHDDPMLVAIAI